MDPPASRNIARCLHRRGDTASVALYPHRVHLGARASHPTICRGIHRRPSGISSNLKLKSKREHDGVTVAIRQRVICTPSIGECITRFLLEHFRGLRDPRGGRGRG